MEYKINKQDLEKMKKAERDEFLEHHLKGEHCYCANCEKMRLRVQVGYWYKKCGENSKKILGLIDKQIKEREEEEKHFQDEPINRQNNRFAISELKELKESITLIIGKEKSK